MTDPTPPAPAARAARVAWLVALALVVAAVGGIAIWRHQVGATAQHARDSAEGDAWTDREATNAILRDTAEHIGLTVELENLGVDQLGCTRNDGRPGYSYPLDPLLHDGAVDSAGLTRAVAAYWRQRGLMLTSGSPTDGSTPNGELYVVRAITRTGAPVEFGSGPGGTTITGESMCALVPGGPTDWPSWTPTPLASYGK
jgi:hypothetical protein